MLGVAHLVRQALLAALVLYPPNALADVSVNYRAEAGEVLVHCLTKSEIRRALQNPGTISLHIAGSASKRSMLFKLEAEADMLRVKPRFPLKPGSTYGLRLERSDSEFVTAVISVPGEIAKVPRLVSFAPSQAVIPANTLRLYLTFSQPMARGQALSKIELVSEHGGKVESPFLNLSSELWNASQTRLTLLLDPGRIKQGVGPNKQVGAPMEEGHSYQLLIDGSMKSAAGQSLGKDAFATFRVGPAERRAISMDDWQIEAPTALSNSPLSIAFDRIMDRAALIRMVQLLDPKGALIRGEIVSDGGGWSLVPHQPWVAGAYQLIIDRELEDISGNTMRTAFDASAGTIGKTPKSNSTVIEIPILPSTN